MLGLQGCKGECPVNVDVATYNRSFSITISKVTTSHCRVCDGMINRWAELASRFLELANLARVG